MIGCRGSDQSSPLSPDPSDIRRPGRLLVSEAEGLESPPVRAPERCDGLGDSQLPQMLWHPTRFFLDLDNTLQNGVLMQQSRNNQAEASEGESRSLSPPFYDT